MAMLSDKSEKEAEIVKPRQVDNLPPQQQIPTLQMALDVALQHHTAGDLSKAEEIYQQILETDCNHPDALHFLGVIYHQASENNRAVDFIMKALTVKPNYPQAHSNLGLALHQLGRLDDAVIHFNKAVDIKPNYAEAHSNLGVVLQELGMLEEARASCQKAIGIKPDYVEAQCNLGVVLQELGLLEEAVAGYHKALGIKPDYAEAYSNLGTALQDLGNLDEAVANYRKALTIKSDVAEVYNNLGNALKEQGKFDEAIASYHKALSIDPDYVKAYDNLGLAFLVLGRPDEVVASYHEALNLTPDDEAYFPRHSFLGQPERHFWMMATIVLLQKLDRPITMLEIGTWLGSSLLTLYQSITAFHSKGGEILCIDPWKPYLNSNDLLSAADIYEQVNTLADLGVAYDIFCHNKNTVTCKVDHCRGDSKEVLPGLEIGAFDVVYIDGSHYYDDVVKDIREGDRLVRDGGYICGDDLEIQWNDSNQDHVQSHKNVDYIQDPNGRYYHPGVTAAVYDVLGTVTCHEGYWIMQKQDGKLKQVRFEGFDSFIPSHFPSVWRNKFKDYVGALSFESGSKTAS